MTSLEYLDRALFDPKYFDANGSRVIMESDALKLRHIAKEEAIKTIMDDLRMILEDRYEARKNVLETNPSEFVNDFVTGQKEELEYMLRLLHSSKVE